MTVGGGVDLDIDMGEGVRMRVEGLGKALRAMQAAGTDAEDMRELMISLGMIVVSAARPRTPVGAIAGGTLQKSLRPGRGKTKSVIRAGGARVPYAGVIHYGWPARNIAPQPFLSDAVTATRSKVLSALDEGIGDLLKKQNLK